eukprot:14841-Eustigmatos_ZCMA.PRE.1
MSASHPARHQSSRARSISNGQCTCGEFHVYIYIGMCDRAWSAAVRCMGWHVRGIEWSLRHHMSSIRRKSDGWSIQA